MTNTSVVWTGILAQAWQHVVLAASALALAIAVGLPLGTAAWARRAVRIPVLALAAVGRTIPSIALLTLLLPFLGVGTAPAVVALALLALPPIIINTDLALRGVPASAIDAACGLGMTPRQRFARIIAPLALPVALSGIRTAAIEVIASATLATFIGGGGLGDDIVRALQTNDLPLLLAASAAVAALAFAAEATIGGVVRKLMVSA